MIDHNEVLPDKMLKKIDKSAMTVNQLFIIGLPIIGFIFENPWPLLFVGIVLLVGLLTPKLALFTLVYRFVVKPLKLLKPNVHMDHPQPHRFAHLLGGIFLLLACVFLFAGYPVVGWTLCWIVIVLAHLNLQVDFCMGCFMYLYLCKWNLVGPKPARASS